MLKKEKKKKRAPNIVFPTRMLYFIIYKALDVNNKISIVFFTHIKERVLGVLSILISQVMHLNIKEITSILFWFKLK